jgi:hypothetical protein
MKRSPQPSRTPAKLSEPAFFFNNHRRLQLAIRSMSAIAIFRQQSFENTANPTAFIDLPVSQT